jgi:D-glycero-D-manno-heptose 1,7-bisphosphate phosphatase
VGYFIGRAASARRCFVRAAFLDRDGVINRSLVINGKPYAPRHLKDFRFLPNVRSAIRGLHEMGFLVIVVTNQPDIGNNLVDPAAVFGMNEKVLETSMVSKVYMCPHKQTDQCLCRKPQPGLLLQAAADFDIDLSQSWMIGDRRGDILAGQAAGCKTIHINRGYAEQQGVLIPADLSARSLPHAVRLLQRLTIS